MKTNQIEASTIYVPVGNRIISPLEHVTTYLKYEGQSEKKIHLVFVKCNETSEIKTILERHLKKCKTEGNMQKIKNCMQAVMEFSDDIFLHTPDPLLITHIENDIIKKNLRMKKFSYSYVPGILNLVERKNLALSY